MCDTGNTISTDKEEPHCTSTCRPEPPTWSRFAVKQAAASELVADDFGDRIVLLSLAATRSTDCSCQMRVSEMPGSKLLQWSSLLEMNACASDQRRIQDWLVGEWMRKNWNPSLQWGEEFEEGVSPPHYYFCIFQYKSLHFEPHFIHFNISYNLWWQE